MKCKQQLSAYTFCLKPISEDSDYVILEDGKTPICEQCVEKLLAPRREKDDPDEAYGKSHGGFRLNNNATRKSVAGGTVAA